MTVLAWILPTVWSPTIIALVLTRWMGGARCGKKRNQGATELPARFGAMAPIRGYRAAIGNGDCGVHRAGGRRRESVCPVSCDSGDVCGTACHRRCRRGAWLARLPAASPRQTIWRDDSSLGDGNPLESVARGRLLCSRHAAPDHATTIDSPLRCSVRSLPGVRVQSSRRVRACHDPGSLVAEHRIGFRRGAAFFDRVLADSGCLLRHACTSHHHRITVGTGGVIAAYAPLKRYR